MKSKKTLLIIISVVLLVVAVGGLIGSILNNKNPTDESSFYLTIDGNIVENDSAFVINETSPLTFKVFASDENMLDYTVKIYRNEAIDFVYYQSDNVKHFSDLYNDFSDCFIIEIIDGGFRLTPKASSVEELLEFVTSGEAITIDDSTFDSTQPQFRVIVGKDDTNVCFYLRLTGIYKILLDQKEIVF